MSLWSFSLFTLLLGFHPPLQANSLTLQQAHKAVWKIHNMKPGETFDIRKHYYGTAFAVTQDLFITSHHVLLGLLDYSPDLKEVVLSQRGSSVTLKFKRVLILSQVYDLALFETTTETNNGYLGLASSAPSLSQLTQISAIGYPQGSFRVMKQRGKVTYKDSLSHAIAFDVQDLHGASGGPVLNRKGKVIGVMDEAFGNLAITLRLKYLEELERTLYSDNPQRGFTTCSSQISVFDCFGEALKQLDDMADQDDFIAQYQSWKFYDRGSHKVTESLQRAADSGFGPALNDLALILGRETNKKSRRLSHNLLKEAASQGYAFAQYKIANMSYYGDRIEGIDPKKLLEKAAEQGFAYAEDLLKYFE